MTPPLALVSARLAVWIGTDCRPVETHSCLPLSLADWVCVSPTQCLSTVAVSLSVREAVSLWLCLHHSSLWLSLSVSVDAPTAACLCVSVSLCVSVCLSVCLGSVCRRLSVCPLWLCRCLCVWLCDDDSPRDPSGRRARADNAAQAAFGVSPTPEPDMGAIGGTTPGK